MFVVVTAVSNRSAHLDVTILETSKSKVHDLHIIVDYGSEPSYSVKIDDPRITLIRIDPKYGWSLSLAYNVGFSYVKNYCIVLKQDADIYLTEKDYQYIVDASRDKTILRFKNVSLQETEKKQGSSGFFSFIKKNNDVFFNPYIKYWGWDDVDLYSRLFVNNWSVAFLDGKCFPRELSHGDSFRCDRLRSSSISASNQINYIVSQRTSNIVMNGFSSCFKSIEINRIEDDVRFFRKSILKNLDMRNRFYIFYLHYRGTGCVRKVAFYNALKLILLWRSENHQKTLSIYV